jgi:hypothetical protein
MEICNFLLCDLCEGIWLFYKCFVGKLRIFMRLLKLIARKNIDENETDKNWKVRKSDNLKWIRKLLKFQILGQHLYEIPLKQN